MSHILCMAMSFLWFLRPSDPFMMLLIPLSTSSPSAVTVWLCFLKGEESSQSSSLAAAISACTFTPTLLSGFPAGPSLLTVIFNISQAPDSGTTALTFSIGLESGENFTLPGESLGPQRTGLSLSSNSIFFPHPSSHSSPATLPPWWIYIKPSAPHHKTSPQL